MGFAALDGKKRFAGAKVARHDLEFCSHEVIQDDRKNVGVGCRSRAGYDHFVSLHIVDGFEWARAPRHAYADVAADRADPTKLAHVVAGVAGPDQRLEK